MGKWKYVLEHTEMWWSPRMAGATDVALRHRGHLWASITASGTLTIHRGYASDGATCAPDLKSVLPATRVHDVLCQWGDLLAERGRLAPRTANRLFFEKMAADGVHPLIAVVYWLGTAVFRPLFHGLGRWFNGPDPALSIDEQPFTGIGPTNRFLGNR